MSVHDTKNPDTREVGLEAAVDAVRAGKLIVLPTDTVYGIGADAFTPDAVEALLDAKGRGRDTPPPVLVGDPAVLLALAIDVPDYVEDLTEAFWPGPLTLILSAQPSLTWDLGETGGTVALRMPDDEIALDLLRRTGPLAVSSANRHGRPAAQTVLDAATQLGDAVEEYLDGGTAPLGTSSTILDTTVQPPEIVRAGALTEEQIVEAVGDIFAVPEPEPSEQDQEAEDSDQAAAPEGGETDADDAGPDAGPDAEAGLPGAAAPAAATAGGDETPDDPAARAEGSAVAGGSEAAANPLDLPAEPELEDLATDAAAPETPLAPEDRGGAAAAVDRDEPAPETDRPENGPG